MNELLDRQPRHPIRVVASRAGLSLHLLRAWERRHQVVSPARGEGGQRLYSDADIERLRMLRMAVDAGRPISLIAPLADDELAALIAGDRHTEPDPLTDRLDECLTAAERLDERALDLALMQGMAALSPIGFAEQLVGPLLHEIGDRWHGGTLSTAHERGVSAAVRRSLAFLLSAFRPLPGAPTLIAATPRGEEHEFGALLASVRAAEAGWRVLYMGPGQSPEELARLAQANDAAAVALSIVHDEGADALHAQLARTRIALPRHVTLLAGGRAVARHGEAAASVAGVDRPALRDLPELLATQRAPR